MPTCTHCGQEVARGRGREAHGTLFCDFTCLERHRVVGEGVVAEE